MTITMNEINTSSLVPGQGIEQVLAKGGLVSTSANKICIIAEMLGTGTGTANTPSTEAFVSPDDSDDFFGEGSFGAYLAKEFFNSVYSSKCELYGVPLTETGTAAQGILTFAGTSTSKGVGVWALGNSVFSAFIDNATSASGAGDAFAAAYNALPATEQGPFTLSVGNGAVTISANNAGACAGAGDGVSGFGLEVVKYTPAGQTSTFDAATLGSETAGTGTPALTTALANIEGQAFDLIVTTRVDTDGISAVKDHVNTQSDGENNNGCEFVAASKKTVANAVSDVDTVDSNDAERGRFFVYNGSTTWEPVIAVNGAQAIASENDNAVSIDSKRMDRVRPVTAAYKYTRSEMNTLLAGGCTPIVAPDNANPEICRCVGMNPSYYGQDHFIIRTSDELRTRILAEWREFRGLKLKSSGQEIHSKGCCTPEDIKLAAIAVCKQMEQEDKLEGVDALAAQFSAEHTGNGQVLVGISYKVVDSVHQIFGQMRQELVY